MTKTQHQRKIFKTKSKISTLLVSIFLHQQSSQESLKNYDSIKILNNNFYSILNPADFISDSLKASFRMKKKDKDTPIYMEKHETGYLKLFKKSEFGTKTNSKILKKGLTQAGNGIKQTFFYAIDTKSVFVFKQISTNKQIPFKIVYSQKIDFLQKKICDEENGNFCDFVTGMAPLFQDDFFLYLEFKVYNSEIKETNYHLFALNLNELLKTSISSEKIFWSFPEEIQKLSFKAKMNFIHLDNIEKEIFCSNPSYKFLFSTTGKIQWFLRYCKLNRENIDQKIAFMYRNKIEFFLYDGKNNEILKKGEIFKYEFFGQKKFNDDFLMISDLEVIQDFVIIFDKRGYGYAEVRIDREFSFRVMNDHEIYEPFCGLIRGGALSCALISYKKDEENFMKKIEKNYLKEKRFMKKIEKNFFEQIGYCQGGIPLNDKNIELLEFVEYENSLLNIKIREIDLKKPTLLSVLNYDYNVLFLTCETEINFIEFKRRRKILNESEDNIMMISEKIQELHFLAYGSSGKSLHNGDGFFFFSLNYEFYTTIFTSTIPVIFLKPKVNLKNSFCDDFLKNCASSDITLIPKISEEYLIKGYVIDKKFNSVISRTKERDIRPEFIQGKFLINIDNFYLGTIVNPRVVSYGDIGPDYIMRHDRIIAKSSSKFLTDFEHFLEMEKFKFMKPFNIMNENTKFYHKINIDNSVNWAIAVPDNAKPSRTVMFLTPSKPENLVTDDMKLEDSGIQINVLYPVNEFFFINSYEDECIYFVTVKEEIEENNGEITSFWENKKICDVNTMTVNGLKKHEVVGKIKKIIHSKERNDNLLAIVTSDSILFYQSEQNYNLNFIEFEKIEEFKNHQFLRFFEDFEGSPKIGFIKISDIAIWHSKYILILAQGFYSETSQQPTLSKIIVLKCDLSSLNCEYFGYIPILNSNSEKFRDLIYLSHSSETLVTFQNNLFVLTAYRLDFDKGFLDFEEESEEIPPIQSLNLYVEGRDINRVYSFFHDKTHFFEAQFDLILLYTESVDNLTSKKKDFKYHCFKISIDHKNLLNIKKIQEIHDFDFENNNYRIPFQEDEIDSKMIQMFDVNAQKVKIKYFWNSNSLLLESDYKLKSLKSEEFKTKEISIRFNDLEKKLYEEAFTIKLRSGFELDLPSKFKFSGRAFELNQHNWGVVRDLGVFCSNSDMSFNIGGRMRLEGFDCEETRVEWNRVLRFNGSLANYDDVVKNHGEIRNFRTKTFKDKSGKKHHIFVLLTKKKLSYGNLLNSRISIKGEIKNEFASSLDCFALLPLSYKEDSYLEIELACKRNSTYLKFKIYEEEIEFHWINFTSFDPDYSIKYVVEKLTLPNFVISSLFQSYRFAFVDEYFLVVKKIFISSNQPKFYMNIYRTLREGENLNFNFIYTGLNDKYSDFDTLTFYINNLRETAEISWYELILVKKNIDDKEIMIECVRLMITKSTQVMSLKHYETFQTKKLPLSYVRYGRIVPKSKNGLGLEYLILLVNQEKVYEIQMREITQEDSFPLYDIKFELKYVHLGLCPSGSNFKLKYYKTTLFLSCLTYKLNSAGYITAVYDRENKIQRKDKDKAKYVVYPRDKIMYDIGPELPYFGLRLHPRYCETEEECKVYVSTSHSVIDEYFVQEKNSIILRNVTQNIVKNKKKKFFVGVQNLFQKFEVKVEFSIRRFLSEEKFFFRFLEKYWILVIIVSFYLVIMMILGNIQGVKLGLFSQRIVKLNKENEILRVTEMTRRRLSYHPLKRKRRVSKLY